jgi:hypothetical protein
MLIYACDWKGCKDQCYGVLATNWAEILIEGKGKHWCPMHRPMPAFRFINLAKANSYVRCMETGQTMQLSWSDGLVIVSDSKGLALNIVGRQSYYFCNELRRSSVPAGRESLSVNG